MQLLIILWSNGTYHYDARIDDTRFISSVEHANKNQSTGIENFFDMEKIHGIYSSYGLHFADRMSYINSYSVRILGEVVPVHQGRGGCPIVSDLDEAKKDKTRKRTGSFIEGRATTACFGEDGQGSPNRATELGSPRPFPNTSLPNSTPPPTQPTWNNPCAENKTESIRVDHLLQGVINAESSSDTLAVLHSPRTIPGCALNTYATTTLSNVTQVVDDVVGQKPHEEQERNLAVLPHIYTVTAPLLKDLTFSNKNQKKREKKLDTDTPNAIAT
ncbi:MAG: hypothetical protein J3R72DRAFT_496176 [Linnemannia gamsii]|nr:MAG: hypothetical protein J3R72DRAFT_496176 [Linnemannia gamsii]